MGTLAKNKGAGLKKAAPQDGIAGLLQKNWDRIESVMPKHMSSERLYQLAVSAINQTPRLAECSPVSLMSCVMKCSALGLEPSAVDGLGRAYILPYRNGKTGQMEAQFIIGYKGLVDLARNSGQIKSISARAVYEGDQFEYQYGLHEDLKHIPMDACPKDEAHLTHVYAIAVFTDGGHQIDVMTKAQVDDVKKRSKSSKNGPWVTDYEAMAVKTVIRRASKTWPMSTQARGAVEADGTDGGFTSMLSNDALIPAREEEAVEVDAVPVDADVLMWNFVCQNCGNAVETADPTKKIAFECCDAPDYKLIER